MKEQYGVCSCNIDYGKQERFWGSTGGQGVNNSLLLHQKLIGGKSHLFSYLLFYISRLLIDWLNFFSSIKQGCQFFVLALFLFLWQWTLSSFVLMFLLQFLLVYFSKCVWVFSSIFLEAIARLQSGYMFYDICEVTLSFFILDKCENLILSPSH